MNDSRPSNFYELRTSYFYDLPEELIAQKPLEPRDHSKLLVKTSSGSILHSRFFDLAAHIPKGSLLILNETKVLPARLRGRFETGGRFEIFLLEHLSERPEAWRCLVRPYRKFIKRTELTLECSLSAKIIDFEANPSSDQTPQVIIEFFHPNLDFRNYLHRYAQIPLPPYIKRFASDHDSEASDKKSYQTLYARNEGSVAAPTAGFHFTERVFSALKARNISWDFLTLHIGGGTFLPVKASLLKDHKMHDEQFIVTKNLLAKIEAAKNEGRKVIAVGTTSLRALEALSHAARTSNSPPIEFTETLLSTDIFIRPGHDGQLYRPEFIDGLITNFHQPESSLFMLICALFGYETTFSLYGQAIENKYRFFSYGDSSLLWL